MVHVIAEPCVDTKDTACVDVCPVDCIPIAFEESQQVLMEKYKRLQESDQK